MTIATEPIPGEWYENIETHQIFRVIDVDEVKESIEIQYINGDIGELESRIWEKLDLEWIDPPENWTTVYDDIEIDDLGYTDTDISPEEETNIRQESEGD